MCSRHQPLNGADSGQAPEWADYWADRSAPHPDAARSQNGIQTVSGRVLAPFSQRKRTHYCHHYRQWDEHWHSSEEELEACLR